jgi:hypothetical protein
MVDYAALNPATADELLNILTKELSTTGKDWWKANKAVVPGYLKSLAEASFQTQVALAEKRITPQAADIILHNQELAFNQTLQFTKLMTLVLGQKLLDSAFKVIGWVILNKTGINLAPNLVQPKP